MNSISSFDYLAQRCTSAGSEKLLRIRIFSHGTVQNCWEFERKMRRFSKHFRRNIEIWTGITHTCRTSGSDWSRSPDSNFDESKMHIEYYFPCYHLSFHMEPSKTVAQIIIIHILSDCHVTISAPGVSRHKTRPSRNFPYSEALLNSILRF